MPRRKCGTKNATRQRKNIYEAVRKTMETRPGKGPLNQFLRKKRLSKDAVIGFRTLSTRPNLLDAYDCFRDCQALLTGLQIGNLRKILSLNCDRVCLAAV